MTNSYAFQRLQRLDVVLHCPYCEAVVTTSWRPGMPQVSCRCNPLARFSKDELFEAYEKAEKRETAKARPRYRV